MAQSEKNTSLNSDLSVTSDMIMDKTNYLPTPSFLECNRSVRGGVAPSASIISAPSLSAASSQRTPAATL